MKGKNLNDNVFVVCYYVIYVIISETRKQLRYIIDNRKSGGKYGYSGTIKGLIRAHFDDNEKFKTISLQIAAHEAKVGHMGCAKEIKDLIQNVKYSKKKVIPFGKTLDTLEQREVYVDMMDIVLCDSHEKKVTRVINEFRKKEILRKNGLKNRSKLLLTGDPGTGKTMTASVIANEINLPLYVIQIDKLVTKYMGETSAKLRQVFDQIDEVPGVYLFDEFEIDKKIMIEVLMSRRELYRFKEA